MLDHTADGDGRVAVGQDQAVMVAERDGEVEVFAFVGELELGGGLGAADGSMPGEAGADGEGQQKDAGQEQPVRLERAFRTFWSDIHHLWPPKQALYRGGRGLVDPASRS